MSNEPILEGFECVRKCIRQRDCSGPPLILKLKDWPASGDMELKGCPMSQFWEGFQCVRKRIRQRDRSGPPLILKLKDWPASGDFAEMLPE